MCPKISPYLNLELSWFGSKIFKGTLTVLPAAVIRLTNGCNLEEGV